MKHSKLLILCLFLANCQEKTNGCLDPEAANFAVEVDKSCDSCCIYPKLQLAVASIWGSETEAFNYQKVWPDASGNLFRVDTVAFYISDITLRDSATGDFAAVSDSIRMRLFPDSLGQFIQKNIALLRPTVSNYEFGGMLIKGEYDYISFKIGLNSTQNKVIPTRAIAQHPLRLQPENMWNSPTEGFNFWKIRLRKDTFSATAPTVLNWPASLGKREILVKFPKKQKWKRGVSPIVRLSVDYSVWFAGVDMNSSDFVIFDKIMSNISTSFQVID
jgi:hypothetical protein